MADDALCELSGLLQTGGQGLGHSGLQALAAGLRAHRPELTHLQGTLPSKEGNYFIA